MRRNNTHPNPNAPGVESGASRPRSEHDAPLDAWLMLEDELHLNMGAATLVTPQKGMPS